MSRIQRGSRKKPRASSAGYVVKSLPYAGKAEMAPVITKRVMTMTVKGAKVTTEPAVISRPYLAPLGADSKRVKRIAAAVKKVTGERPDPKLK